MIRKPEKRFLYQASAVAAAGSFTRPRPEFLEVQAASALPVTGGVASARVENFRFRDLVSFRVANTSTVGTYHPESGRYNTLATAVVEGLNVMDVVTADRVVARLAAHYYLDEREPSILTVGSHFENLRVGGQLVHFRPDPSILSDWDTYSKALEGCGSRRQGSRIEGASVSTSILADVACEGGVSTSGHRIDFPEFGSIYLGEIQIRSQERRLTMLRIAFGCATEGDAAFADVDGHGQPVPPL